MPVQLTLRSPKGGRVLAEREYADGYRIDAVAGWLVVVDRNGSTVAAHAACPGLEGAIVEHASTDATRSQLGEVLDKTVEPGASLRGGIKYPPLQVADLTGQGDDDDRFAEDLIVQLRQLGDEYGPLGVAIAAATLTDPQVLVRQIVDDHGGAEVLAGVCPPDPHHNCRAIQAGEREACEANLDALRAEVARLTGLLDEPAPPDDDLDEDRAHEAPAEETLASQVGHLADWIMEHVPGEPSRSEGAVDCAIRLLAEEQATLATYRREVEEQTARAEREHALRLGSENEARRLSEQALGDGRRALAAEAALRDAREETSPHAVDDDPRRPHPDGWPDDAVLLRYREIRRLVALHLERYAADPAVVRAMLEADVPLRLAEALS